MSLPIEFVVRGTRAGERTIYCATAYLGSVHTCIKLAETHEYEGFKSEAAAIRACKQRIKDNLKG